MSEAKDLIVQGLWKNNSALVQLLGMCPLLAVTSTVTNALGLGLATTQFLPVLCSLPVSSPEHAAFLGPPQTQPRARVLHLPEGGRRLCVQC